MWDELKRLPQDRGNLSEVLILSALLFALLTFLRGTRGEGMLKSLGFLLAVAFIVLRGVAQHYELARLTLVLDAIFQASVIALVVIFQPELRRGLALKIGDRWFAAEQATGQALDEIATAAARLARSREGALIAIERKDSLREWIGSGTIVDSQVNATVLANLFWPGAPLHDGAVVIQSGRVAAAGCFLPLTEQELPKSLGTRHRAAVGLSEAADALVVVVSEETGTISLAEGGRLHRELDRDSLLGMLEELCAAADEDGPPDDDVPLPPLPGPGPGGPGSDGFPGKSTTRLTRRIVTS